MLTEVDASLRPGGALYNEEQADLVGDGGTSNNDNEHDNDSHTNISTNTTNSSNNRLLALCGIYEFIIVIWFGS